MRIAVTLTRKSAANLKIKLLRPAFLREKTVRATYSRQSRIRASKYFRQFMYFLHVGVTWLK